MGNTKSPVFLVLHVFLYASRLRGYTQDIHLYGMVTSMILAGFSSGSIIGPAMSGIVTQNYGFQWTTSLVALLLFMMVSSMGKNSSSEWSHMLSREL